MSRPSVLLAFVFLAACSPDSPQELDGIEETIYSHAAIGIAATYTDEYEAVLEWSRTNATADLYLENLASSDPALRLYGLLGLKIIGSDKYRKFLDDLLVDDTMTPYGRGGCIIDGAPVSSIARDIDETTVETLKGENSRY